jgi:hypothetical protein
VLYGPADLGQIMLKPGQMAGWQTATRDDLTGPYTATTGNSPNERPPVAPNGFVAGLRQTIGSPGATGIDVVRVSAEVFVTPTLAGSAISAYRQGFRQIGFTTEMNAADLPESAFALTGHDVQVAPDFALGTATQGFVFVWQVANIAVIVRVGGTASSLPSQAMPWANLVESNCPGHS